MPFKTAEKQKLSCYILILQGGDLCETSRNKFVRGQNSGLHETIRIYSLIIFFKHRHSIAIARQNYLKFMPCLVTVRHFLAISCLPGPSKFGVPYSLVPLLTGVGIPAIFLRVFQDSYTTPQLGAKGAYGAYGHFFFGGFGLTNCGMRRRSQELFGGGKPRSSSCKSPWALKSPKVRPASSAMGVNSGYPIESLGGFAKRGFPKMVGFPNNQGFSY